jgi:hypothetical protein
MHRRVWPLAFATAATCLPLGPEVVRSDCGPSQRTLPREATAAGMAGRYRMIFVATEGSEKGRATLGRMELLSRDSAAAVRLTLHGKPHPYLREPYFGSAAIDLASLGAYTCCNLASRHPARPGVVVLEYHFDRSQEPTVIQLVVGDENTQRGVMSLDGPYVDIQIREFLATGFRGAWEATMGYTDYRAAGYFCAIREAGSWR